MKRFSQQFHTAAKRVTMTKAESRDLRERLTAYMEYHPLPEAMRTPQAKVATGALASEPFWVVRFNTMRTRALASVATLVVLIIVPFAAEQTVPGDVLYPVKVRFNEEIRSSLALTPYQQVEWETKRVERRLAEARLLATEGKLTEAVEAEVAAAVKSHTDAAQAGLAELRESDSEEAAIAELTFASALEVESEVLESETARHEAAGASTTATLAATIADARAAVASPAATEVSFERLLAQVEDETTHAAELLLSLREDISMQERADIDRRLADIDRKIALALESREIETVESVEVVTSTSTDETATTTVETIVAPVVDEATAKQYLREALQATQKLIRFMTDIDVKANVSVEELVPVTPTDDERKDTLELQLLQIERQTGAIASQEALSEKTVFGLAQVDELVEKVERALVVKEYATAESAAADALALLADMARVSAEVPATPSESATSTEAVVEEAEDPESPTEPEPPATSTNAVAEPDQPEESAEPEV
ncbi:hypothetical protein CL655_02455 [bacterium]|nr:hypothetical protein [bacterium]